MAVEQQKFNDTQPTVSEHIGEFVTNYLFIYLVIKLIQVKGKREQ